MTDASTQRSIRETPRGGDAVEKLRRIVRLLQSAEVLMQRARRTRDTAQAAVLRRRADRRMRDAAQLRAEMGGSAVAARPLAKIERSGKPSRRRIAFRMAEFRM